MDNVWKEAFEHSDTTVGESVAYFLCPVDNEIWLSGDWSTISAEGKQNS